MRDSSRGAFAITQLTSQFAARGLPAPPFPADVIVAMTSRGNHSYASSDMQCEWREGARLIDIASRWLQQGCEHPGAWCEFIERGFRSNFIQVAFESKYLGVFLRKSTSLAFDDARIIHSRLAGSFSLMRRLLEVSRRITVVPNSLRLAIADDDDGIVRWGWVAATEAQWSDLTPDAAGWISAQLSLDAAYSASA